MRVEYYPHLYNRFVEFLFTIDFKKEEEEEKIDQKAYVRIRKDFEN